MNSVEVKCSGGILSGIKTEYGYRFLGVPYAFAQRFSAPVEAQWNGVWDAARYGSIPAQPNYHGKWPADKAYQMLGNENCQNLNIWTPSLETKDLPVLVYIHGGAFQSGSGNDPECSGERFCDSAQVVYVTVNERVGLLGYLELGEVLGEKYEGSSNNGVKDILAALHWIKDNISLFGGDPAKVTLMGTSAGAKLISSLLTNPDHSALFSQIIVESGSVQSLRTIDTARALTRRFMKFLGRPKEDLLTMSTNELMKAQAEFCDSDGATCYFGPVFDGRVFHEDWKQTWDTNGGWHGNALIGSCRHELFNTVNKATFMTNKDIILSNMFGSGSQYAEAARQLLAEKAPEMSDREAWTEIMSDFMYRTYSYRLAEMLEKAGCGVWMYSFDLEPAVHGMGQAVSLRQFGSAKPDTQIYELQRLSRLMRMYFLNFCIWGTPERPELLSWPKYQEQKVFSFDIPCRVKEVSDGKPLDCFPEYVFTA